LQSYRNAGEKNNGALVSDEVVSAEASTERLAQKPGKLKLGKIKV